MRTTSQEQTNYVHLVADIAWFGLALAATSRFLSIYAIRLGANSTELSLIAALPGLVLLISTSVSRWWRRRYPGSVQALLWPSFTFRLMFLFPVFAPFFPREWQPIWLLLGVMLPALPQGIAGAIFITVMRESVAQNRFTALTSNRSLVLNITVGIGALAFGAMLEMLPFPMNYQLMFLLAFGFAVLSHWHVTRIHVINPEPVIAVTEKSSDVWHSRGFLTVAIVAFLIHAAFFSIIMVTPMRLVNELGAGEGFMAIFGLAELVAGAVGASLTPRLLHKWGTEFTIATAMIGTACAAWIIASADILSYTLVAAAISGGTWTVATVALLSLLIERTPSESTSGSSVAFQQVVALGIFIGPMIGWLLIHLGLSLTLILFVGVGLRILAGFVTLNNPASNTRIRPTKHLSFLGAAGGHSRRR